MNVDQCEDPELKALGHTTPELMLATLFSELL